MNTRLMEPPLWQGNDDNDDDDDMTRTMMATLTTMG
jgi:hypothetical protein